MARTISIVVPAALAGLVLAGAPVSAAEGYVCGPDRIVYVEARDLEHMKRTDPCIASFFGLKVEQPAGRAEPVAQAPETPATPTKIKAVPQPQAAPKVEKPAAPRPAPSALALKILPSVDVPVRRARNAAKQAALVAPAVTTPGTDFRNVRVLNAQTPETAWFHHTR